MWEVVLITSPNVRDGVLLVRNYVRMFTNYNVWGICSWTMEVFTKKQKKKLIHADYPANLLGGWPDLIIFWNSIVTWLYCSSKISVHFQVSLHRDNMKNPLPYLPWPQARQVTLHPDSQALPLKDNLVACRTTHLDLVYYSQLQVCMTLCLLNCQKS